jgi:hypothetical protein
LKHWRAFVFPAYGRKSKPPAPRVVVDSALVSGLADAGLDGAGVRLTGDSRPIRRGKKKDNSVNFSLHIPEI